jgi:hypothetical protein
VLWDEDGANARVPRLGLPFAVVGLAAGWLSARAVSSPLFDPPVRGISWGRAAITASVAGAILGVLCRRWCRRSVSFAGQPIPWHLVFVLVELVGAVTGAIVGAEAHSRHPFAEGTAISLCCAVPVFPVVALVIVAAQRAARARLGSIVAAADRRTVWAVLFAGVAPLTLPAIAEWLPGRYILIIPPVLEIGIAVVAFLVVTGCVLFDLAARARLRRIVGSLGSLEPIADVDGAPLAARRTDVGLGSGARARVHVPEHYRRGPEVMALVIGQPEEADRALATVVRHGWVRLMLVALVLAAHVLGPQLVR